MTKDTDSILPIFIQHHNKDKLEQIGSGVLLKLKDKVFLLTAAHVTDWLSEGALCIPTTKGIQVISGYVASLLVPNDPHHQKRTNQEASDCLKLASNSIGLWKPLVECNRTGL